MQATREELHAFIGNKPTIVQKRLIDRAAVLALRLALIDARAPDGSMTEKTAKEYLCWSNAYVRLLTAFEASKVAAPPPTTQEILSRIHEAHRAGQRDAAGDR